MKDKNKDSTYRHEYSLFFEDPAEYKKLDLKEKLAITVIELIRNEGWSQTDAASKLKVSQPRISNLMNCKIDKFSVDSLLEMLFRTGHSFEYLFDFPDNSCSPRLEMKLKKAIL